VVHPRLIWDPIENTHDSPDHLGKLLDIPDPVVVQKKRWAPSLAWAIPILAALLGLSLIIKIVWMVFA
jgi:hypothetical protein